MKRYRLILVMVTALLSVYLASVLPMAVAAEKEIVHFHDGTHGALWLKWLNEAAAAYPLQHPDVKITILPSTSRSDHQQKIMVMYATNVLPDVIEAFPSSYYQYVLDGVFQPLNPYMSREKDFSWNQFFPAAEKAAQYGEGHPNIGNHWMLPVSIWTVSYVVNNDMFNAGLTHGQRSDTRNPVPSSRNTAFQRL
jgi:ABC-type glycerol-3-phosphate transport system substrate-binding protein